MKQKMINGKYRVCDCEHFGDIERSANFLRGLNCVISETFWDRRDCGDAWIEFTVPECHFLKVYHSTLGSCEFNVDVNDYIKIDWKTDKLVSRDKFNELEKNMRCDVSEGFEKRLPLLLWFEESKHTPDEVIEKVLSLLGNGIQIIAAYVSITDGTTYYRVLLTSPIENVTKDKMESIGDYCLGCRGWLKSNRIYGECKCVHILMEYDYDLLKACITSLLNKNGLVYGGKYIKDKTYPYDEIVENGILKDSIFDSDIYEFRYIRPSKIHSVNIN